MSDPSPSLETIPNCVFHDGLKSFLNQSSRVFRIDIDTRVSYQSLTIRAEDIGQNTIATLTFNTEENRLVNVDITTYHAKLSIGMQFQQGFLVFSERMFPTEMLVQRYEDAGGLKVVASKFPAVRQVNSAYAKGFWTAVGIGYLEHLCSPVVAKAEMDEFISRAELASSDDYRILDHLHDMRRSRDSLSLSWLEVKHNDKPFQQHLSDLLKSLCVKFVADNPTDPVVELLPYGVEGLESQLKYTMEIEQDVMCVLALALRIKMIIYDIDGKKMAFECAQGVPKFPLVYLLYRNGAYHILYSEAKLQAQGYSLSTNTRIPPQQVISTPGLQRALYHTPQLRTRLIAGEITSKLHSAERNLQLHVSLNANLQRLIIHTFETLQKRIPDVQFFDDSICTQTTELSLTFTRLFAEFKAKHSEMAAITSNISILDASNFANTSAKAMNLCDNGDKSPGFWRFSCKHVACRQCIQTHIESLRKQYGFLVTPDGSPKEYFQCPISLCRQKVCKEEVAMIVGEDGYQALITEAEETTFTRHCQHCDQDREKASFFPGIYCQCKVCRVCIADLVNRQNGICLCEKRIPSTVVATVANYKMQCSGCGEAKGLLDNFTHMVCRDHLLCRECLEKSVEDGRCKVCYRVYAEEEMGSYQWYFLKKCQLGCGRMFLRSQGVTLACKCHYCFDCAREKAISTESFTGCLICKWPFPEETVQQFYKVFFDIFTKRDLIMVTYQAEQHRAPICPICLSRIGVASGVDLECGHFLHKDCFRNMLISFTATVMTKEVACPECQKELPGNLLNQYMDDRCFSKYNNALMRIKLHLQTCPHCQFQFEYISRSGGAEKIACPNLECKFAYCSACQSKWEDSHDPIRCRFNEIQEQIKVLEAEAKGDETKKVSQCPGCQIPYLKDNKCEHVKCANPQCNIEWCFECSVDRAPILAHHNQWHRPQCRMYTKPRKKDTEQKKDNCPECKRLGRRCDPPKDLKVPRRFTFEKD